MSIAAFIVLGLLVAYIIVEAVPRHVREGFVAVPIEPPATEGDRDMRYAATHADVQGTGYAVDFCRAITPKGEPHGTHIACALGNGEPGEIRSKTVADGLRLSRDDYWARRNGRQRMDYCRILRDEVTGEWFSSCLVTTPSGFKSTEERDTDPPPAIQELLDAYDGILAWYRWHDDGIDYAGNTVTSIYGKPEIPALLGATLSRGLQLNRYPAAAAAAQLPPPPIRDYLRWGEPGQLRLEEPRQIRAISAWVWLDVLEPGASIVECGNGGVKDRMWLGVVGGGPALPQGRAAEPATELRPAALQAVGQLTEPGRIHSLPAPPPFEQSTSFAFEVWDETQRLFHLESPTGAARPESWTHVTVTVTDATAWWPTWQMWINGELVATRTDGRSPTALEFTQNYIGRGLRGCIQDFRMYTKPMTAARIRAAVRWGRPRLHPTP